MNTQTILIALLAAVVAFAAGALWQYSSARSYADRLEDTNRELTFQRLQATLGAATIEAQRGSHEIARQLASDFFTRMQDAVDAAEPQRRQEFQEILAGRDLMITALSRADPQAGSMLAQLFTRFRIALGEPVGPEPTTTSPPPPTTTTAPEER